MQITYEDFQKVDIRLGKIIDVQDFSEAHTPAFKLKIDFGAEIGVKTSSAQLKGAHTAEELMGTYVLGVVNFPPKQIGPFISEVLTLGLRNSEGDGWILVVPAKKSVTIGDRVR